MFNFTISMMSKKLHLCQRTVRSCAGNKISCFMLILACLDVILSESDVTDPFPTEKCEKALPECHCEEGYIDVAVLTCLNVSNFEHFSQTLSDGSVFKVNSTLDIDLTGVRTLPREFLKGLILERLYIDDVQTEIVEDGAFDGMLGLQKFHIQSSSIRVIPDFRPISSSLRNLNLVNSLLTSLSSERLKHLPLLETVSFVNNSIQSIASDAFEGTDNVIIFDLSFNQLRVLPQNLFNSWRKLKKVVLTSNQLLNVDQLFAVANPLFIYLDYNNLTDLDSILHPNMTKLQTLLLSYNPLSEITENSFNGKANNLHSLFMDHCNISGFNANHFKALHSLQVLDLSYNSIGNVTNQTIHFGLGLELSFGSNNIKEFNVNLAYRVAHLNLNKNLQTSLSRSLQNSQIIDMNMAENRIETLSPEDFRGVYGVQTIDLHSNLIRHVDPLTFQGIRRDLSHLDLSQNLIRSLQGSLRDLHMLTSLNLTGNLIESLSEDEFQGMAELLDLYLDNNRISTLGSGMSYLDQLRFLGISRNMIATLKPEQIPQTLMYLSLEGNPIKCDCQMTPFLRYMISSSVTVDKPLCAPSNETPALPPASCPAGCDCFCYLDQGKHFMSVDCSSKGLTELPNIFGAKSNCSTQVNCSSMSINLKLDTQFSQRGVFVVEDVIGGLNLTHNNMKSLEEARLPVRMQHLFLSDNQLHAPPLSLLLSLENLNKVSLSNNPWNCDCKSLRFKEWILFKSQIVMDANETRCGTQFPELTGRTIWTLSDMDLCPVETGSSKSLVIGLSCFFVVLAVIIIALAASWSRVRRWLVAHGIGHLGDDESKEFENFHLLHMNGFGSLPRNNFPLPSDRQSQSGDEAEFHPNSSSLFQEQPINPGANRYDSITT